MPKSTDFQRDLLVISVSEGWNTHMKTHKIKTVAQHIKYNGWRSIQSSDECVVPQDWSRSTQNIRSTSGNNNYFGKV